MLGKAAWIRGQSPRYAPISKNNSRGAILVTSCVVCALLLATCGSVWLGLQFKAPAAAYGVQNHPAGRIFGQGRHHHNKPAGAEVGSALEQQLHALRAQVSLQVTQQTVKQQLQGSKLPRGVSTAAAQQLLIDKQLLEQSLQAGHAAARNASMARYYTSSTPAEQQATAQQQSPPKPAAATIGNSSSRGILIVGGSRTHLGNAYILLRVLRQHLHCQLPVEVVYYGPEELDPAAATLVTKFAAAQAAAGAAPISVIDGKAVHEQLLAPLQPHPEVELAGWVAKVHALAWVTTFQQVLLLDSDNLPVQDPAALFDTPAFLQHGFVIWPDFWHNLWMKPAVYHLLGLPVPWEVNPAGLAAESGQILIDRLQHHDVLEWLWFVNSHAGLVYKCVVGDKDTFKMAFELAGKQQHYMQVQQPPQELLGDAGGSRNRFFHLGMGQASPDGSALMFLHRTARGKFFPWCAARRWRNGRCQPAWLSLPVVQEQLTASVRDAGSMRFDSGKIDTRWYLQQCQVAAAAAAAEAGSARNNNSSSSSIRSTESVRGSGDVSWVMPLPVCSSYKVGQLPIPAVPAAAVPGLPGYLAAVDAVFEEVQQVLHVQFVDRVKVFFGIL